MTNDGIGAFFDWLEGTDYDFSVVRVWGLSHGRNYIAKCGTSSVGKAYGATCRKAIANLAECCMPKPQCCGECALWSELPNGINGPRRTGDCLAVLPESAKRDEAGWMYYEEGNKCPAFQPRPA